jgi:hypothetical protein
MGAEYKKAKTDDSESVHSEHLFFSILRIAQALMKKQVQAPSKFPAKTVQKNCCHNLA